ncbi:unnamed protein product, partial [Mesorhabditis spiculigera]
MQKLLMCVAVLAGVALASKEYGLKTNRIPTGWEWNSTCDECQSFVHRFEAALKNPTKMAELKALLRILCHETSYVDECRAFVAHLDDFISKLDPYLQDAKAVCTHMHLCTQRTARFHRIGQLYSKLIQKGTVGGYADIVCDECQFAATELKQVITDKNLQQQIRDFFRDNVCARFGKYRGDCDMVIEQFLPELFQELEAALANPKKVCHDIGFCGSTRRRLPGFLGLAQGF